MINRKHRFHGHNALNYVYTKGRSVRGPMVSIKFAPSKGEDYRLAVVVSKKVSKSAVVRNRIRRRLYEIVRVQKLRSDKPWPQDMILSVFDERVATMPAPELEATIVTLLQKTKLI